MRRVTSTRKSRARENRKFVPELAVTKRVRRPTGVRVKTTMEAQFRERFISSDRATLAKEDYDRTMGNVKRYRAAVAAGHSVPAEKWGLLHRFDVATVDGQERLVVPVSVTADYDRLKVYAYTEEVFGIIRECHKSTGHGSSMDMHRLIKLRYQNITTNAVALYVGLCKVCKSRHRRRHVNRDHVPDVTTVMTKRGQVDVVDMRSRPDGPFRHYMVYRDQVTGYAYLQALTTDHVDDVTYTVFDLFATFGAPAVLQSENGRAFATRMVQRLRTIWSGLQLVHGDVPPHAAHGRRPNQIVEDMLAKWMSDNKTSNWCVGLKIVQNAYNNIVHPGMECSPYELMFGTVLRSGLIVPQLPANVISTLTSEEDVRTALGRHVNIGDESIPIPDLPTELTTEVFTEGKVGDYIKVKLMTGKDQGMQDIRDTEGVILSVKDNLYEIGTDLGRLPKLCTRKQFQICGQETRSLNTSEFPLDELCAYEVTQYYSVNIFSCRCLKQCRSYKCICKRMKIQCKSVCHNQSPCFNKAYRHPSLTTENR